MLQKNALFCIIFSSLLSCNFTGEIYNAKKKIELVKNYSRFYLEYVMYKTGYKSESNNDLEKSGLNHYKISEIEANIKEIKEWHKKFWNGFKDPQEDTKTKEDNLKLATIIEKIKQENPALTFYFSSLLAAREYHFIGFNKLTENIKRLTKELNINLEKESLFNAFYISEVEFINSSIEGKNEREREEKLEKFERLALKSKRWHNLEELYKDYDGENYSLVRYYKYKFKLGEKNENICK